MSSSGLLLALQLANDNDDDDDAADDDDEEEEENPVISCSRYTVNIAWDRELLALSSVVAVLLAANPTRIMAAKSEKVSSLLLVRFSI